MSTLIQPLPAPRQIRFVNNQGHPPLKRKRINAACLTCRKRKTRCAGERPTCSTCEKNGHACLGYTESAVDRKNEHDPYGPGAHGAHSRGTPGSSPSPGPGSASRERSMPADEMMGGADDADSGALLDSDDPDGDDEDYDPTPKDHSCVKRGSGRSHKRRQSSSQSTRSHSSGQTREWPHDRAQRPPHKQTQASSQPPPPEPLSQQSQELQESQQQQRQQQQQQSHHHNESTHRVPYFRYFGPTAIVPGYKQMVVDVSVRDRRLSRGSSFSTGSPGSGGPSGSAGARSVLVERLSDLPVYDPNDPDPVHPLIFNLIKTFFVHLGCNYPFLREERVMRMVREKQLETILVDAMCALAARFSDLPVFTQGRERDGNSDGESDGTSTQNNTSHRNGTSNGKGGSLGIRAASGGRDNSQDSDDRPCRSEFGHVYALRAKAATVDTFPCPTVAAVQACLLMAYEGFGADQDSALWMYLGLAIRMAVDLGLQKKVGVTPQREKDPWFMRTWNEKSSSVGPGEVQADDGAVAGIQRKVPDAAGADKGKGKNTSAGDAGPCAEAFDSDDLRAAEQERIDTFWAVFFLDRVISSGTGRPVTFRDDDFELALPEPTLDPLTDWPAPFPILAQIIHLYGRVSDVLNNIHSVDDLTQEKMQRLAHMENDLTQLYQRQDPRLTFNALNFQAYVRAGQGTTFILLHFWFHALIIILHQPTLLTPFGGLRRMHQLLPNSHELSMSSAKTIADILAFAELIDPKSFIGNPFTSQPMYIAACAFLLESIANASPPASKDATPVPQQPGRKPSGGGGRHGGRLLLSGPTKTGASSQHLLLASNANQNYQRCYQSLQQLHRYWGGVRYILTALDQKSKGIWDCETFTSEELESTKVPPMRRGSLSQLSRFDHAAAPHVPPIAWSLTGTTNSANPSLTLLYQSYPNDAASSAVANQEGSVRLPSQRARQRQRQPQPQPQQHLRQRRQQQTQPFPASTPSGHGTHDPIRQSLFDVPSFYSAGYPQANESAIRCSPPQPQPYPLVAAAFAGDAPALQGPGRPVFQYEPLRQGDLDAGSPGTGPDTTQGLYDAMAYQQHQGQQQQQQQSYVPQQHAGELEQQSMQTPGQAYNTPSTHDGAILAGASPSSNRLGEFGPAAQDTGAQDALGALLGGSRPCAAGVGGGDPYAFLEMSPIADMITVDSGEVDISTLSLPVQMMPQWLEYLPSNVVGLFDDSMNGMNGASE